MKLSEIFQSTHPLRGATRRGGWHLRRCYYFNPRTPCGVRRQHGHKRRIMRFQFQSTHPLRGATVGATYTPAVSEISIHAPLAGCDSKNVQRKLHFF